MSKVGFAHGSGRLFKATPSPQCSHTQPCLVIGLTGCPYYHIGLKPIIILVWSLLSYWSKAYYHIGLKPIIILVRKSTCYFHTRRGEASINADEVHTYL